MPVTVGFVSERKNMSMNKTVVYKDGQPCPKCKDTNNTCPNCGRIHAQGQATITTTTSEFTDTLLSLLDREKAG